MSTKQTHSNLPLSEDLIYVCVSDPVDLNPELFRLWARGKPTSECLEVMKERAMQDYDMSGLVTQRQLHRLFRCIEKDIIDQFRIFSMLEPFLRKPALRKFQVHPMSEDMEKLLVAYYFDMEDRVLRTLLGMVQTNISKKKKIIRDLAVRLNKPEMFCVRQVEIIETVLDHLVQRNSLQYTSRSTGALRVESPRLLGERTSAPGFRMSSGQHQSTRKNEVTVDEIPPMTGTGERPLESGTMLFEAIIEKDFSMPSFLARKYAAVVFLCRYEMEVTKGKVTSATLGDLIFIARTLMRSWALPVASVGPRVRKSSGYELIHESKENKDEKKTTRPSENHPANAPQSRQNEATCASLETKTTQNLNQDCKQEPRNSIDELEIKVVGDSLDKSFLVRLESLKSISFVREKQALEDYMAKIRATLLGTDIRTTNQHAQDMLSPPDHGRVSGQGSNFNIDETAEQSASKWANRCGQLVRSLISLATRLHQPRELRDLLVSLWNSISPLLRAGLKRSDASRLFDIIDQCCPSGSSTGQEEQLMKDFKRFLSGALPICKRLAVISLRSPVTVSRRVGFEFNLGRPVWKRRGNKNSRQ
ncbi:hypothetical protein AAMO2058_001524600 [Amorphochlora amoebiformis]